MKEERCTFFFEAKKKDTKKETDYDRRHAVCFFELKSVENG